MTTTYSAIEHVKNKHRIDKNGPIPNASALEQQQENAETQAELGRTWTTLNLRLFQELLIRWIVIMHITFSQVENESFRDLLLCLCKALETYLPRSGTTIKNWLLKEFKRKKAILRKELQNSKSLIHLSFDGWTSPNNMGLIGVVAHYMASNGEVKATLLGLRRLRGAHSGENMAEVVLEVLRDYGIESKIGYFVLDNVASNDVCVRELVQYLSPFIKAEHRRLRCFGHVINLAAKAFLYGSDVESFEVETKVAKKLEMVQKELDLWRKKGPVGKVHNIAVHSRKTPQRRENFLSIIPGGSEEVKGNTPRLRTFKSDFTN